jgi:AraC family transcriptional regulator
MDQASLTPYRLRAIARTMVRRLGFPVVVELRPIIDAIAASLQEGQRSERRDVSVTLPVMGGDPVVVSVRSGKLQLDATPEPFRGLNEYQLRLVDRVIDERMAERLSVSMLSSTVGLSRSHFSVAFRRSVGRTPREHVVRLRIERAMELLRYTNLPIGEIALGTGFCDQAHFANTFRRATGLRPTEWRKRNHRSGGSANEPLTMCVSI